MAQPQLQPQLDQQREDMPEESRRLAKLIELFQRFRVVALTGAGCSTESGIPDYRGPATRNRTRNPIQHREFMADAAMRQRYWARATLGWPRLRAARPNLAHQALATLESAGKLHGVITQNVDRLHTRAGSQNVVELHGALEEVVCCSCGTISARDELQRYLLADNPGWLEHAVEAAPDGDARLGEWATRAFRVPACPNCDGILKPNVVFHGGSVSSDVVHRAFVLLEQAEALVVVGSSLAVFSGYRFARRAAKLSMPIALVNIGPSRADALACLRLEQSAGQVLNLVAKAICG